MANLQELKRRKQSIQNIGKITKAMQLVSTSKSIKARNLLEHSRDYYMEAERLLSKIISTPEIKMKQNMFNQNLKKTLWVVISSDLGLCGNFNNLIFKEFQNNNIHKDDLIISIGSKVEAFLKKNNYKIYLKYKNSSSKVFNFVSERISQEIFHLIKQRKIGKVKVIFTEFINQLVYEPKTFELFPLSYEKRIFIPREKTIEETRELELEESRKSNLEIEIETEKDLIEFCRFYISVVLYGFLSESLASEHVARRISMENATNNSKDLVDKLTIEFNRKRQSIITQQINEIVGGSNNE